MKKQEKQVYKFKCLFGNGYSIRVLKNKNSRYDVQVLKDSKVIFIKNYANLTYAIKKVKHFDSNLALCSIDISKLEMD